MLRQDGDDDRGILRALALVNGRGVRRNQGVEFAETTGEHVPVETRGQFTFIGIDIVDIADVAVIPLRARGFHFRDSHDVACRQ